METTKPYTKLAAIYDRLMDHVDYIHWGDYIIDLIDHSGGEVGSLIDLSCGTGSLISHLQGKIPTIFGCDNSKEMISEARKKKKPYIEYLFVNDIRRMAIKDDCFDCALFLYDSLNYLINDISLENSLNEINRILKKGGIFIFDVVSENHCIEHYRDFHENEYWDDEGYSRHSFYDPTNGYQFNDFRIVIRGKTFIEKHQQKVYDIDYLISALNKKSFKIIGTYNDFSNEEANSGPGRVHFLCTKL
ncbi:MAG: class I SAM-dependent methyltransferase [Calditrichia bacterium]|nr:class I SAM-dependent methyltransferase [Calditrichia bacterium]